MEQGYRLLRRYLLYACPTTQRYNMYPACALVLVKVRRLSYAVTDILHKLTCSALPLHVLDTAG